MRFAVRRGVLAAAIGTGLVVSMVPASAQADDVARPVPNEVWVRDNRFRGGPGINTESYRISPWVGASIEYDSNVFLRSGNKAIVAETPIVDAFRLAITPTVSIEPRGNIRGRSFALSGFASATYFQFLNGLNKRGAGDDVPGQSNFGAAAGAKLQFAPGARVSGDLHGTVVRTIQPGNIGDPNAAFNRTTPSVGAGINWAPGGGLFSWGAGYDLSFTLFDKTQFKPNDNTVHSVSTTSSWKFLPRTSVFTEARYSMFRYSDAGTTQSNGDSVTARAGLNGLVTNGFGFLVSGGWSSTFFDTKGASNGDFDSFVAQVEGRFYLAPPPTDKDKVGAHPSTLNIGYLRDWQQSYIGNFFQRDRLYAQMGYFLSGRWFATTGVSASRIHFPQTVFASGAARNPAFDNYTVEANGALEFRPTPHFGILSQLAYTQMISDTKLLRSTAANDVDDQAWTRFTAMLGVRYLF